MKAAPIQMTRFWAGVTAMAAMVTTAHAQKREEAWEYLKEPGFKSAYIEALRPMANKAWLAKRDGPAPEDKFMQVAGERDAMNAVCKNRECGDNSAVMEEGVALAAPVAAATLRDCASALARLALTAIAAHDTDLGVPNGGSWVHHSARRRLQQAHRGNRCSCTIRA